MTAPIRLRLSRAAGFDLQAESLARNGLPAVVVTRSTIWGNRYALKAGPRYRATGGGRLPVIVVHTLEEALARYEADLLAGWRRRKRLPELAGKNLACFCREGAPCHADILLRLANGPSCERVE